MTIRRPLLYMHYLLVTICVGLWSTFEYVSLFVVLNTFFQIFIPAWSWYWVLFKNFCISLVLVLGLRLTIFWIVWGRSITLKTSKEVLRVVGRTLTRSKIPRMGVSFFKMPHIVFLFPWYLMGIMLVPCGYPRGIMGKRFFKFDQNT
jgi:hypothetical protein